MQFHTKTMLGAFAFLGLMALSTHALAACPPVQVPGSVFTQKGNSSVPFADISYNTPAATDTLLLVHFDLGSGGIAPISVTYGGLGLTQLVQGPDSNSGTQQVWYLLAPKPGTASLHVATSGANVPFNIVLETYSGVSRSMPIGAVNQGSAQYVTSYSTTANIVYQGSTSTLVDFLSYGSGDAPVVTLGSGQTQAFILNGAPSSTVSSTLPSSVSLKQAYTFQWPVVIKSLSVQLLSDCI